MRILKLTTLGLALAALGCGSSTSSQTGFTSNSNQVAANLGGTPRTLQINVPPGGGVVTLPRTENVSGTLTFAPGATPGTVLTLILTETAPPGTEPDTFTGPVQRDGFYYILWDTNQSFDFALVKSIALVEGAAADGGIKPKAIADDAELFQAELGPYSQGVATFGQALQGRYNPDTGGSEFSQPDSMVMQPGNTHLLQAKSIQTEVIKVQVTNNSGVEPAYVCVLGNNPNAVREGKPDPDYYWVNAQGKMVPFDGNDRSIGNTTDPNGKVDGYTELYNIPLQSGTTTFNLPQMSAGRMYISLGRKMQIRLEDDRPQNPPLPPPQPPVRLAQPNGWTNPGDPNYQTLFDWLEFDYKINPVGNQRLAGIGINKTEVDMMGFGVQFEVNGPTIGNSTTEPPAPVVGTNDDGRRLILETIDADPFFRKLIVPGPAKRKTADGQESDINVPLRCIAPVKGLENSFFNRPDPPFHGFDLTYFDDYLTKVWTRYGTQDLKCYTSAFGTWYGRVDANNRMVFTCVDENTEAPRAGFDKIYVRKPSTTNAFEPTELITSGGITYQPNLPNDPTFVRVPQPGPADPVPDPVTGNPKDFTKFAASEIISALSAAMNRTTLLHESKITRVYTGTKKHDLSFFYKKDAETDRINVYAKAIHDNSRLTTSAPGTPGGSNGGGAAYAFGFDDNSNQSSYLSELSTPTDLKIVITKVVP